MAKLLQFDDKARTSLSEGVHILAHAVRGTLGPKSRLVVLDRPIGKPAISNDGVSIANEIELGDRFLNMGVQLAREAAFQTNEVAGDGTTTSAILADALVQQAKAAVADGANTADLTRDLDRWGTLARTYLDEQSFAVPGGSLAPVTCIAAGDVALGQLVAEVYDRLGAEGHIELEPDFDGDRVEYQDGMQFDRGYISHHLVTNVERMIIEMQNAAILVTDQPFDARWDLSSLVKSAEARGRGLLIVAEDYDAESTAAIVRAHSEGPYPVAAIRAPEFGPWRKLALEDLTIATGAQFLTRDLELGPEEAQAAALGLADSVIVASDRVSIGGGHGSSEAVAGRKQALHSQLQLTEQPFERQKLKERLTRLSGSMAKIYVGGATTVEQRERLQRAEDALYAGVNALRHGVIVGGGVAYLVAAERLALLSNCSDNPSALAQTIFCRSLEEPFRTLAENSGLDPDSALRQADPSSEVGLNAMSGRFENLREAGVLDSLTAVKEALANALSVAKLVLNTTVLVCDTLDGQDATEGPARGGGGERLGMH